MVVRFGGCERLEGDSPGACDRGKEVEAQLWMWR